MNLIYITTHLNTHHKCIEYLEKFRWNGAPKCPYCSSFTYSPKGLRYTCLSCSNSYSVTVGTLFENSNLPLNKWFIAITLILSAKKGISSLQLSRDISVNKNTAWLLQMKIKRAFGENAKNVLIPGFQLGKGQGRNGKKIEKLISQPTEKSSIRAYNFSGSSVFWSQFKRAIIGQYHRLNDRYVYRYLDELHFKQRHKLNPDRGYSELMVWAISRSFAKY